MRSFSKFEKEVLKYMVNNENGNSTFVLLGKLWGLDYWGWAERHPKLVYYPTVRGDSSIDERAKLFDLIILFDYLESNNLAMFFDSDVSMLESEKVFFEPDQRQLIIFKYCDKGTIDMMKGYLARDPAVIGEKLERYTKSIFHVTQTLRDYVEKGFLWEEERQFKLNYRVAKIGVISAIALGCISLLISLSPILRPICFHFFSIFVGR